MPGLKAKILHTISDFADESSMHGFRDIKDSITFECKIIWTVAISICVLLLGFQTKTLLDAYWAETTAVGINTIFIDEQTVHTVVYCSNDWVNLK